MAAVNTFSIVVVTGLSGAGKSTALRVFEDLGFFCVDGLPASMLPKLAGFFQGGDREHRGLVLGMDLRQQDFPEQWNEASRELGEQGVRAQIVFLEAKLESLVKRYAQTRRPHPLESQNMSLDRALEQERGLLAPIRDQAELVIDTTDYSIHDLRRVIQEKWAVLRDRSGALRIHIVSFGYKYGLPLDADLIFDLRFLPNPYFEPELKPLSGEDQAVADYVLKSDVGMDFAPKFLEFLKFILPMYAREGRFRVTLGMGCTGGRHRSVAVSELAFDELTRAGYAATLEHRHCELG